VRRLKSLLRPLATPLKIALLAVVFMRFRATWIGATVVLGMGILLFGLDRTVRRWAARALGGK
jgi:hypothetical protein